ncbi:hypothetical protein [Tumebacillus flagellatus]|uniref:Copper amine oxidase-like N-terminal domain-containing protein n=1 Tax=Tumebacillus flagellatus TaxID=1157490 RepID=A0A074LS94_9BACL|nr:hypothetical protein [Tumebacillus flagellatus]KEO82648.1 hypothetical protein EL26_13865 [Tumebacillus flagellatus]
MKNMVWSACMISVMMVGSSVVSGTMVSPKGNSPVAVSVLDEQRVMDGQTVTVTPVDSSLDVHPLLGVVASVPGFEDWGSADVAAVRNLHDREGAVNAVLWRVQTGGKALGYLVTTPDGQSLYEFSRRPTPELPGDEQAIPNGYLYGGPALQLAYVQGQQGPQLYNLMSGEELPSGELLNRVPDKLPALALEKKQQSAAVTALPEIVHGEDDAVYATGLYGKMKLGEQGTGGVPLQEFAKQTEAAEPAEMVYDAIPDKLFVALNLQQKITLTPEATYFGVTDPFALNDAQRQPVYVNAEFPVTAVPVRGK